MVDLKKQQCNVKANLIGICLCHLKGSVNHHCVKIQCTSAIEATSVRKFATSFTTGKPL